MRLAGREKSFICTSPRELLERRLLRTLQPVILEQQKMALGNLKEQNTMKETGGKRETDRGGREKVREKMWRRKEKDHLFPRLLQSLSLSLSCCFLGMW